MTNISGIAPVSARGMRAGRYELLTRIAAGGMGEVFIARQTGVGAFEKRVALKLLLPHLSEEPEFVHMFLDEARIAARMNHPNIIQIFDVGQAEGRHYLAMGLIEGVSLSQLLRACRSAGKLLPLPLVRLLAVGLCEGLDYAHHLKGPRGEEFGVIHRDVTPSNLMVSATGGVFLNDFGIAKAQGRSTQTRTGQVKGKYAYMPPEQLDSRKDIDARVDVFAASVTLFQALTLVSPFLRSSEVATLDAVRGEPLPDLSSFRPDVTPAMAETLRRGVERDLSLRLPSVRELLDGVLDGPVAQPHELGAWVRSLCAADLAVFQEGPASIDERPTGTLSPGKPTLNLRPPRTSRLRVGLGALALLLAGLGAFFATRQWAGPAPSVSSPPAVTPVVVLAPATEPAPTEPAPVAPPVAEVELAALPAPPVPVPVVPAAPRPASRTREVKSPPKQAAPTPLAGPGFLSVDARPWAVVFVDGQEVDRTPIARYPLPAGSHRVRFENPELNQKLERQIQIEPGKVSNLRVDFP